MTELTGRRPRRRKHRSDLEGSPPLPHIPHKSEREAMGRRAGPVQPMCAGLGARDLLTAAA